jgi:hypothetical protein
MSFYSNMEVENILRESLKLIQIQNQNKIVKSTKLADLFVTTCEPQVWKYCVAVSAELSDTQEQWSPEFLQHEPGNEQLGCTFRLPLVVSLPQPVTAHSASPTTTTTTTTRLCLTQVDRWRHSVSDVVEYVTTEKLLDFIFNILPVFIRQWEIQTHWVYTGWLLLILKLSSWNISDSLHKLRISDRISFSHYKQKTCVAQI